MVVKYDYSITGVSGVYQRATLNLKRLINCFGGMVQDDDRLEFRLMYKGKIKIPFILYIYDLDVKFINAEYEFNILIEPVNRDFIPQIIEQLKIQTHE